MDGSKLLTTPEVANLLRRSVRSIHELTRDPRGGIPHRKFGRPCVYIESEIMAWLDGAELEVVHPRGGGRVVRVKRDGMR
jgi:hypothetical protein